MDSNAKYNEQRVAGFVLCNKSTSLLPTTEFKSKHFTNEESISQFAIDGIIDNLGLPTCKLKIKEVNEIPNADSLLAMKSGIFGLKSSNTFDRKLDEIFHNYNKNGLSKLNESDSEDDQFNVGQPLKVSKAILDLQTSALEASVTVQNKPEAKNNTNISDIQIMEKKSKSTQTLLEKGVQVEIITSKIVLEQLPASNDLKLPKMNKCHKTHRNLGDCCCKRFTKHVSHVSFPRPSRSYIELLREMSTAIKTLKALRSRMDEKTKLREAFLKTLSKS